MKKKISISICIPVFNEEKNIKRCLDSIKKQKFDGTIEVIIIDNGCVDKTISIAKKYKFVKVIKNKVNDYIIAKKMGLDATKADYYTYLDADIDLPTNDWVAKMIKPLEEDKTLTASTTGFVSYKSDPSLNKYLTLDLIQRDPLFVYLTPGVSELIVEKRKGYDVMKYSKNKILPMGLCVFRRKMLLAIPEIKNRNYFHELDNLIILLKNKHNKYAFVGDAGLHHLTVTNLKAMVNKRIRNLKKTFFVKNEKRYWNWIDTTNKDSLLKLIIWVAYAETLVLPFFCGIYKSVKYRTIVGMYEPIVVFLTTNAIMYVFLTSEGGRNFLNNLLKK